MNLYCLVHDSLSHFGADKSYTSLYDAYYWPNMWTKLEKSYIPSCNDCQWNKLRTKPPGPLHLLPIPDECGDSVALNFIGPLPLDHGYDCILLTTYHLGSSIHIIPTHCDSTAEDIALLVFDHWCCENGLLLDWVSDRDKLFMSWLWKTPTKLTGIQLKMLSTYHPLTDGTSERTNKMINQSIHFHGKQNQEEWVCALPHIWFCMMSTINTSTGYSGFQLHLEHSPHLIPPIILASLPAELQCL